ncbi:MAG: hypothetical protein KGP28_09110 [Bdellovibrionales bacterium]|nr:hypothetical protein [Bdellovibrionales bacterium]
MKQFIPVLVAGIAIGSSSFGQIKRVSPAEELKVTVRDVSHEYSIISPEAVSTPTPPPVLPGTKPGGSASGGTNGGTPPVLNPPPLTPPVTEPLPPLPGGGGLNGGNPQTVNPQPGTSGGISLNDIITIGQKVWDFVVSNKPNATYQSLKAAVVPSGITSWTQLRGWSKPVSKVYRVEFTNMFGQVAGSFDYRINFVYGGSYQGKGKYIGQISFVPAGVKLSTDRTLDVKAELLDPLNFGTEEDPIAGVELQISWSTPTTTRYQLNSVEFFLYGTGEIQDMTHGN